VPIALATRAFPSTRSCTCFAKACPPKAWWKSYPALTLEQVHGALAWYLANQGDIDAYLAEGQRTAELQHAQSRQSDAELIAKLQRARHASQIPGGR